MRVLILGAGGMLGFAIHRTLTDHGLEAVGTVREVKPPSSPACQSLSYLTGVDANDLETVDIALMHSRPDVVINAIVMKSSNGLSHFQDLINANSVFPRQLEQLTERRRIKLIHFSTDGVYGQNGSPFRESDIPKPNNPYAISKYLGEPLGAHTLTFRLSLIGFGLKRDSGLLDWFFGQSGKVKGYSQAIFSGLPANEVARMLVQHILPKLQELQGIYNFSAQPISKFSLLTLVKIAWNLTEVNLLPDPSLEINRSLCSGRLNKKLNYEPSSWPKLVEDMKIFYDKFDLGGTK